MSDKKMSDLITANTAHLFYSANRSAEAEDALDSLNGAVQMMREVVEALPEGELRSRIEAMAVDLESVETRLSRAVFAAAAIVDAAPNGTEAE